VSIDIDPGIAALGNPRLIERIIAEMDGGAIPFERFMELALYDPDYGYYRKAGRIGREGDFLTSPAIHPMFGWAVAGWCRWAWQQLGEPAEFTIFEPGAGQGQLATAILDWAEGRDDGFRHALRYVALEPNAPGNDSRVEWAARPLPSADAGVVVANELFDAFPVRLFEAGSRGPAEIYVRWDGERFVEVHGGVTTIDDAPGQGRFEVNQHAYPAMRSLCGLVERGSLLVFDYGYPQEELWADWRRNGTLTAFYRHTAHEDPYIHVGEQDLTTHVNFSELATAAEEEGFTVAGPVRQAAFLANVGMGGLVESARGDMAEYFARRRAFEQLTDPGGLGRINVLAGTRGLEGIPAGFEEETA
jgi:SAM-dependent MidA family methyltransferase